MTSHTAKSLAAGNWKMNGLNASLDELNNLADAISNGTAAECGVLICPPYTVIASAAKAMQGRGVMIGAQDCHMNISGAHTGDISAEMLKDAGASHVIVGHSERRADHGEGDALVRAKAIAAVEAGLVAIVCVGETEQERDAGNAVSVVTSQLDGSLPDDTTAETIIVAYEPVWAIGTGRTPTVGDVEEMHNAMRANLVARFGESANAISLLYGGSVKPSNASELMGASNVNGALVGGASLKAADFDGIIDAYR